MYPIKYIDNNIVVNKTGEFWAYYEFVPYNYSFLSEQQKHQVGEQFQQLVAQIRDGRIHALQIATDKSIRTSCEKLKADVHGPLADVAREWFEDETNTLVETIGLTQVDYRFFIGFQLTINETDVGIKQSFGDFVKDFLEFIRIVNRRLMGEFVIMNDAVLDRYFKVEHLLSDKVSRRFKIRPLDKNDLGYILDHIHGQTGATYEQYEWRLPKLKRPGETLVKWYDILRPVRCTINESRKYLEIDGEKRKIYVACFTISDVTGELEFPSSEIFYYQQQQFDFPIDTSMQIDVVPNRKALKNVRNKKKELKDSEDHAVSTGNDPSEVVEDALDTATELETDLSRSKDNMYKLSYVVRVAADSLDELEHRCDEVKDFYDDYGVKLIRPVGDMIGLHEEFMPSGKRYEDDYVQDITSDFLAGMGFGATQKLGEEWGLYLGFNIYTDQNVYLRPDLAAQGVLGTVTNSPSAAVLGNVGGGKSATVKKICHDAVLAGAKILYIDPKGECGDLGKNLQHMSDEINIINLTNDPENRGLLDPYILFKNPKDAESAVTDMLTYITGISGRDPEKFPVLLKAISRVTERKQRGTLCVIDELRNDGSEVAIRIADHIESYANYDFAHLLFSDGSCQKKIGLDKAWNIIQIADLVLPDRGSSFDDYTINEFLSVAMLIVISTYALDFISGERGQFKIVVLDEAWSIGRVSQGAALFDKLVRMGRSMNSAVYFVTQSASDLKGKEVRNNIGMKLAFRNEDIEEIRDVLEFYGLDPNDESAQKVVRNLDNGQCLFRDLYGHIGVVQVDFVNPYLFRAVDTRPPKKKGDR